MCVEIAQHMYMAATLADNVVEKIIIAQVRTCNGDKTSMPYMNVCLLQKHNNA